MAISRDGSGVRNYIPAMTNKDPITARPAKVIDLCDDEPDTPALQVFYTAELVENILLRLSSADAIRARSVCKFWKNVTASTLALREHVFLDSAPSSTCLGWEEMQSNVFAVRRIPVLYQGTEQQIATLDNTVHWAEGPDIVRRLHPLLRRLPQQALPPRLNKGQFIGFLINFKFDTRDIPGDWRKMLLTQPPCRKMHVRWGCEQIFTTPGNLTLGDLYDWVKARQQKSKEINVEIWILGSALEDGPLGRLAQANSRRDEYSRAGLQEMTKEGKNAIAYMKRTTPGMLL